MGGLRAVLEASWRVLEASWRCLGDILGRLGGILDVSWGKYQKKMECNPLFGRVLGAKIKAKIVTIHVLKTNLLFVPFFGIFFVILHAFESQLVMTCSR